jgi:hypothetical protein
MKTKKANNTVLIVFALVALAAVFAFIFVFAGKGTTGEISNYQKIGTSTYRVLTAEQACATSIHCNDGLPGIPTGVYDELRGLYECRCQTSDLSTTFWRSRYRPG